MQISGLGGANVPLQAGREENSSGTDVLLRQLQQERERQEKLAMETQDPQRQGEIQKEIEQIDSRIAQQTAKTEESGAAQKPSTSEEVNRAPKVDEFLKSPEKAEKGIGLYRIVPDEEGGLKIELDEQGSRELFAQSPDDAKDKKNIDSAVENKGKIDEKDEVDDEGEGKGVDPEAGWSWAITELIPDPEDPDNPAKATFRIVAQGLGKGPN